VAAPSTTLRVVPLPRCAGEESRLGDPCQTAEISVKACAGFGSWLALDRELLS